MDLFDVEAKADCSNGPMDRARYTLMIQSMLEDRFQLKAHTELREVPIYELLVAKDGLKLKPSAHQTPVNSVGPNPPVLCLPPPSTPPTTTPPPAPGRWSSPPPRPNDGTPTAASDPVPILATAIQQLGLRLESVKAPIDVLVVESAQKPKVN
jgi:Protein of unknown function (DUF3738)